MKILKCLDSWKCLELAGFVFLFLCASILLMIVFWLFFPYKTIDVKEVVIHDHELQRGGELKYSIDFCKYTKKPALVEKEWVDGVVFKVPAFVHDSSKGCHVVTPVMEVPTVLPDGAYKLEILYIYQVNPIRQIIVKEVLDDLYVDGDA